jgi:magnesium transporter
MLSGFVIDGFEEALQSIAALAVFIPLIMTMGGNVGTQSSTVFVRGVATGQLHINKFWWHFAKEIGIGITLGLIIGLISGAIAAVWQGSLMLGFVVGAALLITMAFAALLGFLVPYLLMKFKIDQAAGSTPILTALKDILGLVIYFILVSTFLGHML